MDRFGWWLFLKLVLFGPSAPPVIDCDYFALGVRRERWLSFQTWSWISSVTREPRSWKSAILSLWNASNWPGNTSSFKLWPDERVTVFKLNGTEIIMLVLTGLYTDCSLSILIGRISIKWLCYVREFQHVLGIKILMYFMNLKKGTWTTCLLTHAFKPRIIIRNVFYYDFNTTIPDTLGSNECRTDRKVICHVYWILNKRIFIIIDLSLCHFFSQDQVLALNLL